MRDTLDNELVKAINTIKEAMTVMDSTQRTSLVEELLEGYCEDCLGEEPETRCYCTYDE